MKRYIKKGLVVIVASIMTTPALAYYDVTLGTTDTAGYWNGNEWIPNGTGSTVSVNTIQSKLAQGAVTIGTGTDSDGGTDEGNITVSNALSWDANTLTLTAANALNINAVMTAGGTAGLAINTPPASPLGYGLINVGMGGGDFIGRVDFTGSGNTLSINGDPVRIITTLGSESDIANGVGLQGMENYVYSVLGADIDASPTASWNDGLGFNPLGITYQFNEFWGPFDGLGHTIDGLTINRPGEYTVGLFNQMGCQIRNLGLTNVNIAGGANTGAVAGITRIHEGEVANIYVTGTVTGTDINVGGLVGHVRRGMLSNAHFDGSVSTTLTSSATFEAAAGGLVGRLGPSEGSIASLSNCHSSGSVSGLIAGGLVGGILDDPVTIDNCYSDATLTGSDSGGNVGGLLGWYNEVNGQSLISNSYFTGAINAPMSIIGPTITLEQYPMNVENVENGVYFNVEAPYEGSFLGELTAEPPNAFGVPLSNAQMQQQVSFVGFDFDNTWVIYEGHTAPLLRAYQGNIDSDGDGYYNNEDAFPVDDTQWLASPNAFSFTQQSDAVMNTVVASNTITVSGISAATPISIDACSSTSCEYRIDAGLWRSDASMVNNGDTVQVRQLASGNYATQTSLTLNIGDASGTFSVTTEAAPVVPVDDGSTTDNSTTDNSTTDNSTTDNSTTDNSTTDNSTTDNSTTDSSTTDELTSRGGGGCTINPQAGFDPIMLFMIGASLLYLRRRQRKDDECNLVA